MMTCDQAIWDAVHALEAANERTNLALLALAFVATLLALSPWLVRR